MKNIQIIDGAENCTYDIFAATDDEFDLIFPDDTNIAFIDDVYARHIDLQLDLIFERIWQRRLPKVNAIGIHGTIFYELGSKKKYYPSRKDEEAINPDGSRLR
jgi:hypothetical protein